MKESALLMIRTISSDPDFNADLDLGIVDLSRELAARVLERHRQLLALREHDEELCHIAWWDCSCTFASGSLDDSEDDWVVGPSDTREFEPKRTEVDEMRLDEAHVWWSCSPRHLDINVETHRIPIAFFRDVLRESEPLSAPSPPNTRGAP